MDHAVDRLLFTQYQYIAILGCCCDIDSSECHVTVMFMTVPLICLLAFMFISDNTYATVKAT